MEYRRAIQYGMYGTGAVKYHGGLVFNCLQLDQVWVGLDFTGGMSERFLRGLDSVGGAFPWFFCMIKGI